MLSTCATCGELCEGTYCPAHSPADRRPKDRNARGYDAAWARLSRRARRLQPFCTTCGTTEDLTVDHTPEAWRRREAGKPIRLEDIAVLCRSCNSKAGAARGEKTRGDGATRGKSSPLRQGTDSVTFNHYLKVCEGVEYGRA